MGPCTLVRQPVSEAWRSWGPEVSACIWKSKDVFATALMANAVFTLSGMIIEPSLRSWVVCNPARGAEIVDVVAFSGSAACRDKAHVVQRAVQLGGILQAVQGIVCLLAVPMLGAYSDQYGRLPVLYVSFVGMFVWLWMSLAFGGSTPLLLIAFTVRGFTSAFSPTFNSILADRGGNRSVAFTLNIFCAQLGVSIGWVMSLVVLRAQLLDYSPVWLACLTGFGVSSFMAMRIDESLPGHMGKAAGPDAEAPQPAANIVTPGQLGSGLVAFKQLMSDAFFFRYCTSKFMSAFGFTVVFLLRSYVLSAYDWPQGRFEAITGLVGLCGVVSTLCGPALIRRFSVEVVLVRSALVVAVALTFLCLAPLGPFFCLAPLFLLASVACVMAASSAMVAERFPAHQGKAQSALVVVVQLSGSVAQLVYSQLYHARAVGGAQALPFIVAAVAGWVGYSMLLTAFAMPVQKEPPQPEPEHNEDNFLCIGKSVSH